MHGSGACLWYDWQSVCYHSVVAMRVYLAQWFSSANSVWFTATNRQTRANACVRESVCRNRILPHFLYWLDILIFQFEECCALCLWARTQAQARCCLQLRSRPVCKCMRIRAFHHVFFWPTTVATGQEEEIRDATQFKILVCHSLWLVFISHMFSRYPLPPFSLSPRIPPTHSLACSCALFSRGCNRCICVW